ncbi:proteinase inhibitor I4 serpin-like protein [Leptotrombidium deliense]|uniref:Proteinase inhibitor I4 serpin-like protein n=1 Tax=Leptotrombidium deliense TaxID=299467 RepID=A0A443S7Q2_9ACAR|nr:proteinase inhibitor I4 serpin-like protein [Leptotrombidium deliense]
MTLVGAKNETEKQIFEGLRYSLGFENSDEVHSFFKNFLDECEKCDSCNLNIANRVLIHKASDFRVKPEYAQRLLEVYKAEVNEANFETETNEILKSCNEWVNKKTNGKIPSILDSLSKLARAVLINAIYFKGMWQYPDKSAIV